jgi:site-specific DNA-methyltransferase (adenine-specific)
MLEIDNIYQGDSLQVMKELPDNSIDLVLTDPPYGHNNNDNDLIHRWESALGKGESTADMKRPILNDGFDEANRLFSALMIESKRILKNGGVCCCCCGGGGPDPMFARWSLEMGKHLKFMQMVVWDKGKIGMGWCYRRSYETILVGYKGKSANWYDETDKVENIIRHIGKIIPKRDNHPTEKPVKLMEHFIRLHTKEDDLVLDPFLGSGTTAVACVNLNRHYIGIELDQSYVEMARKRVAEAKMIKDSQLELFEKVAD